MLFWLDICEIPWHIVEAGSIRADPDKVEAICTWPKPTTVKELQQFLGLANYYV